MNQKNNWKLLFKSQNPVDIELKKKTLENNDIKCHILNKMDSSFNSISFAGETIELYVLNKDFAKAVNFIKKSVVKRPKLKKRKTLNTIVGVIFCMLSFFMFFVDGVSSNMFFSSFILISGLILLLNY